MLTTNNTYSNRPGLNITKHKMRLKLLHEPRSQITEIIQIVSSSKKRKNNYGNSVF